MYPYAILSEILQEDTAVKNRKGTTLAELCVAIALLAVVVTMTLTFSQLNREHLRQAEEQDALMTDLTRFEQLIRQWLRDYDNLDYTIRTEKSDPEQIVNDMLSVYKKGDDETPVSNFYLTEDKIKIQCDGLSGYAVSTLTGMKFSIETSDEGRRLISCDLSYVNLADDKTGVMHYIYTVHSQGTADGKGAVIMRPLGGLFKPE